MLNSVDFNTFIAFSSSRTDMFCFNKLHFFFSGPIRLAICKNATNNKFFGCLESEQFCFHGYQNESHATITMP